MRRTALESSIQIIAAQFNQGGMDEMVKTTIRPTRKQLDIWMDTLLPDKDLFFIREEDFTVIKENLTGALLFPRKEFFNHSSYQHVQMVSSYMYWTISADAAYVVVAEPRWLTELNDEVRNLLLQQQIELCGGLTIPLSKLQYSSLIPKEFIVPQENDSFVIIRRAMWDALSFEVKVEMISLTGQLYDAWEGESIPAGLPNHLSNYANTFSDTSGANCLAAVLFAISTEPELEEWIIHEWVHPETFALQLQRSAFIRTADKFKGGDVVVWVNEEDVIQHAAYCIDGTLFFNKSGQLFTNPWKIVDWVELEKDWERFTPIIYRKTPSASRQTTF